MRDVLFFSDLVLLHIIRSNSRPPGGVLITRVAKLSNQWLTDQQVPARLCGKFASSSVLDRSMKMLRSMGLVEHLGARRGFRVTANTEDLFDQIGTDWKQWFVSAPVTEDVIQLVRAKYDKDYRVLL